MSFGMWRCRQTNAKQSPFTQPLLDIRPQEGRATRLMQLHVTA